MNSAACLTMRSGANYPPLASVLIHLSDELLLQTLRCLAFVAAATIVTWIRYPLRLFSVDSTIGTQCRRTLESCSPRSHPLQRNVNDVHEPLHIYC